MIFLKGLGKTDAKETEGLAIREDWKQFEGSIDSYSIKAGELSKVIIHQLKKWFKKEPCEEGTTKKNKIK